MLAVDAVHSELIAEFTLCVQLPCTITLELDGSINHQVICDLLVIHVHVCTCSVTPKPLFCCTYSRPQGVTQLKDVHDKEVSSFIGLCQ